MIEQHEAPPASPVSSRSEITREIGKAAALYFAYALAITALNHFAPPLHPAAWAIIGTLSTIAYLLVILHGIRLISRLQLTARFEWVGFALCLLLFLALNPMVWQLVLLFAHGEGFWQAFGKLQMLEMHPVFAVTVPFFLILTGVFFGRLVSRLIRERALLIPVGIISGMIDFWGVYWGPVGAMSENAPVAVSSIGSAATVATSIPDAALQTLSGPLAVLAHITPPESIGIGDFVFLAFFFTCAYRLGFSARGVLWGLFAGLLLASTILGLNGETVLGVTLPKIEYLPGLVFICAGVLIANVRAWKLTRQEWLMTGVLVALLGTLIGFSAVRAEMAKPRSKSTAYTLPMSSSQAAMSAALQRITDDRHGPHDLVLVEARFAYQREKNGDVTPVQWAVLVLGRMKEPTVENSREYFLIAQPQGKMLWQVQQVTARPPSNAVGSLRAFSKSKAEALQIIRSAKGIPPSAFNLLKSTDDYAGLVKGQKLFMIRLLPREGGVYDAQGKMVKGLEYGERDEHK